MPLAKLRGGCPPRRRALNDAFVAGISGGLRRYHEKHGSTVGDLHLTMPISIRKEGDDMGGNHITLARFDVPVGMADPAARISSTRERTTQVRNERSTAYVQILAGAMNLMPRWYIGSMLRKVDFLASDVPGLPVPVYLGGAKVKVQYAFGPTIGAAVNVTADVCGHLRVGYRCRHRCHPGLRGVLRPPGRGLRRGPRAGGLALQGPCTVPASAL